MKELRGKTIWLIGATHGIGEALTAQLVAKRMRVVASGRSAEKLQHMHEEYGDALLPVVCDVSDMDSIRDAYVNLRTAWGIPDIVMYNAGVYDPMPSTDFDLARVEQMIDVNVMGAIRVLHNVVEDMQASRGTIALVGSVAGYRGLPKAMGYGLSKAAIIHLAENLRQDAGKDGLRVQLINPGFVKTRLTEKNDFAMPCCITAQQAAKYIVRGLEKGTFEIHFPKRFTLFLKLLQLMPARLYFWLCDKIL
jgi:NADP-dependent 3-hydroxy acid dehydrogenase YdfG